MKKVVAFTLLCSLSAAAAEPPARLLPSSAPLVSAEPLAPAEVVRPPYAQAWFWGIWGVATLQTAATAVLGLVIYVLLNARVVPLGTSTVPIE